MLKTISPDQINDGVKDCFRGIDETCAWKENLKDWVNPKNSENFKQGCIYHDHSTRTV